MRAMPGRRVSMSKKASRKGAKTPRAQGDNENEISKLVLDEAIALHRALGPGLLESVYEAILVKKLMDRGYDVKRQLPIPLCYEGLQFEVASRADVVIEDKVLLELKSVEQVTSAHRKQVLTYLKLSGLKLGLLLNFSADLMTKGTVRVVNQLDDQ